MSDLVLEAAEAGDLPEVAALVERAGLPTTGLPDGFPGGYSIARAAGRIAGVAGLERYGEVALLRSVAVAASQRGKGIGRRLVEERLARAGADRIRAVYLLTTTAAPFFGDLGFETTSRDAVPDELRRSSEFASVCPSTAVCMVKRTD